MSNKEPYELHRRKSFFNISVIFVAVVIEGDKVSSIFVNSRHGNNGTPQTAPNVFYGGFGIAFIWLCIDIENVFMFPVTAGLCLFERRTGSGFHSKGVENHDKAGSKVHGFILLKEHA